MLGADLWTLPRRALARLGEFLLPCELFIPGFHDAFFGPYVWFHVTLFIAGSFLFDILEIVVRPDLRMPPCVDEAPELPLEGGE